MDLETLVKEPNGALLLRLLIENCERLLEKKISSDAPLAEPKAVDPVKPDSELVIFEPAPLAEPKAVDPVKLDSEPVIAFESAPLAETRVVDPVQPETIDSELVIAEQNSETIAIPETALPEEQAVESSQIEADRAIAFAEYEEEVELTMLELQKAYHERGQELLELQKAYHERGQELLKVARNDQDKSDLIDRLTKDLEALRSLEQDKSALIDERDKDLETLRSQCAALEREKSDRQAVLEKYKSTDLVQTLVKLDQTVVRQQECIEVIRAGYEQQLKDLKIREDRLKSELAAARPQRTYSYGNYDNCCQQPSHGPYYVNNMYGVGYLKFRI
jgi:hypothetical protein